MGERRITALFGGSFDPIHLGHMFVVNQLLNAKDVDEIWIVPTGDRPDKPNAMPIDVRLEMARLAIAEYFADVPRIWVKDIHREDVLGGVGTIDLVRYCRREIPEREFGVVIGSELVQDLKNWKKADELRTDVFFLVVARALLPVPHDLLRGYRYRVIQPTYPVGASLSSSMIREMLSDGAVVQGLLPSRVAKKIDELGLYRSANI
jgi:nicotinate-nucleotide adenylyltransferase